MGFTSALLLGFATANRYYVPPAAPRWGQNPARQPAYRHPAAGPAPEPLSLYPARLPPPALPDWQHDGRAEPAPPAQAPQSGFGPAAFAVGWAQYKTYE